MKQTLSTADWDRRFRIQARWSKEIRQSCRLKNPLAPFSRVLEVGCGTGAVLSDFAPAPGGMVAGIDLSIERLEFFRRNNPGANLLAGDGYRLPFIKNSFDQVFCHYLLLWLKQPLSALQEIKRILTPGGMFFIFSEPDYGGCIDFPKELKAIKDMQIDSLLSQGADPFIGRKIPSLLLEAGFGSVESGVLTWSPENTKSVEEFESEWEIIQQDNAGRLSESELSILRSKDAASRKSGSRVQFLPVFYAWGTA